MKGRWESIAVEDRPRSDLREWAQCGCATTVAALAGVGLLLLWRRLAGTLTAPLPALPLAGTVVVVGAVVLGGRVVWRETAPSRERQGEVTKRAIGWGGSAAIVLLALGCSLGRGMDWLLWLPLVAADQWQLRWFLDRTVQTATTGRSLAAAAVDEKTDSAIELQRLVRVRDAGGDEVIHGTLRAEFVAGQRHATVHVGFCPPLERTPAVEAEAVDGPDAEVKVTQAFAHGSRLEVRLAAAAEEDCSVVVEVSAKPLAAGVGQTPMVPSSSAPL